MAVALSIGFVFLVHPSLDTLVYDFDEAWLILDSRFILRGLRPFVDFAHHEPPLHLYLLTLSGKVFGQALAGYRMLSAVSLAASGLLLFCLARPFVGAIPALVAQVAFYSMPGQVRALAALPETPTVLLTLFVVVLLFLGKGRPSAYASGVAMVIALLIKPTSLVVALAAAASLAHARAWRRLGDFVVSGIVMGTLGLAWMLALSDRVFTDTLLFHVQHLGARSVGMWSIDSGFADIRRLSQIDTPLQYAFSSLQSFYEYPERRLPLGLLVASLLAIPIWVVGCGRSRPAIQAFAVLWPVSYGALNFLAVDFASTRYFVPFLAFSAFLLSGWVWLAQRRAPLVTTAASIVVGVALLAQLPATLGQKRDPWYYGRAEWITEHHPVVLSFTPMLFAATGAEPGCGLANPALTYGSFGESFLTAPRTKRFRVSDETLVACLKANPEIPVVIDWAFYFFTRPGSRLRQYLAEEARARRLFFSQDALDQWSRPRFTMSPFR
jgi:4-amino-4-deoxy-L-arabinose transferase-like glycosyltransferase